MKKPKRARKPARKASRPRRAKTPSSNRKRDAHANLHSLPRLGVSATYEKIVPQEWTIQSYDPRLPPVLSTPAMIGMMEVAAGLAIMPELPPGAISVGTRIEVDHLKAIPVGANVVASARLAEYRGRFLVFEVDARSGDVILGRGRVFRAIVLPETFLAKASSRQAGADN